MQKINFHKCDITLQELNNKLHSKILYTLVKDKKSLCIGDYTALINLHKRLKNIINYAFVDNKKTNIVLSYNDKEFYIKNKKFNIMLSLPNEQVSKLSANIGKFIYTKMIENKTIKTK